MNKLLAPLAKACGFGVLSTSTDIAAAVACMGRKIIQAMSAGGVEVAAAAEDIFDFVEEGHGLVRR